MGRSEQGGEAYEDGTARDNEDGGQGLTGVLQDAANRAGEPVGTGRCCSASVPSCSSGGRTELPCHGRNPAAGTPDRSCHCLVMTRRTHSRLLAWAPSLAVLLIAAAFGLRLLVDLLYVLPTM